jgi:hypothetical protein
MQKPFLLDDLYIQYRKGLLEKKQFEGMIFETVFEERRRFNLHRWRDEDCGDFMSWVYPRLSKAIDSYRDTGASFETYIGAVVRWSSKEYRARMADSKIAEYTSWTVRFPDEYVCQTEPEYFEEAPPEKTEPEQPGPEQSKIAPRWRKNPRQLLFLILKCYWYISDDFLDRIAPRIGIETEYLKKTVDKMRALRLSRDEELRCLRERIYCQFYRCIMYEKRLAAMPENSVLCLRMKSRLQKARQRLEAMRKRLAGTRPDATNRQIAEIIGISKGTVDASLYALKSRWNNDPDKSILN